MREPRNGESVVVCVVKHSKTNKVGVLQAIVRADFIQPVAGPCGSVWTRISQAVTAWFRDHKFARELVKRNYNEHFSFEELVDHLGGGFDDSGSGEMQRTDLEWYLRDVGIQGMEVDMFTATDAAFNLWQLEDSLIDEEEEED